MPTQAANTARFYDEVYQDLVDYPNFADALNNNTAFPEGAVCCRDGYLDGNVSTAINAHVAQAHRRLADLSRWLGRPAAEAARFDGVATGIVEGLRRRLLLGAGGGPAAAAAGYRCDPPAPACYLDGLGPPTAAASQPYTPCNHTSVQATLFVAGCNLLPPAEALQLLPFLKAKTAVRVHPVLVTPCNPLRRAPAALAFGPTALLLTIHPCCRRCPCSQQWPRTSCLRVYTAWQR